MRHNADGKMLASQAAKCVRTRSSIWRVDSFACTE